MIASDDDYVANELRLAEIEAGAATTREARAMRGVWYQDDPRAARCRTLARPMPRPDP